MWTVGKAAEVAHVSVRTLHHYDEIGLLSPSERTEAGYRQYTASDMVRLEQILFFKEMGFSLDRIQELMVDPTFDQVEALRLQRSYLEERIQEYELKVLAIERALESSTTPVGDAHPHNPYKDNDIRKGGTMSKQLNLTDDEVKELFGDFDPREYEEEAEQRWGNGDPYKESARRTKSYNKDDWERINAENEANTKRLVELFAEGRAADDPDVLAAIDEHRGLISKNFYECSLEIYNGLADMYVCDPRFTKNLDKNAPGFAQNLHDAMKAYVASKGGA